MVSAVTPDEAYAEAIANGDNINKCPPGGQATIEKLADLMGVEQPSLPMT